MSGYQGITAGYLIASDRPCLVETGTARSAPAVREALDSLGIGPTDLATIAVTHIHLDHAGGVGDIAAAYPHADVVVHQRGARHLADPTRLMNSARQVFGIADGYVFGPLLATDAARIHSVGDIGSSRSRRRPAADDVLLPRPCPAPRRPARLADRRPVCRRCRGHLHPGDGSDPAVDSAAGLRPRHRPGVVAALRRPGTATGCCSATSARSTSSVPHSSRPLRSSRTGSTACGRPDWTTLDLDHAVTMLRERTAERYGRLYTDPELDEKFEALSSTAANITGINRWLDKLEADATAASCSSSPSAASRSSASVSASSSIVTTESNHAGHRRCGRHRAGRPRRRTRAAPSRARRRCCPGPGPAARSRPRRPRRGPVGHPRRRSPAPPAGGIELARRRVCEQRQRSFRSAQAALGVRHHRQVRRVAGHPPYRSELGEGLARSRAQ